MASSSLEPGAGRWAAIARKDAPATVDVPLLKSTAGLKTLVVDANAIIGGGVRLAGVADQFVTVREVLDEVRDPASRFHLSTLPVTIRCLEPSAEALTAVTKFSRATGDFPSLSSVDLKLISLAYTLEAEVNGAAHIRSEPPPLLVRNANAREKDLPGWGSVDNPEEWECIEANDPPEKVKTKSRILGLKHLNVDLSSSDVSGGSDAPAVPTGRKQEEVMSAREHIAVDSQSDVPAAPNDSKQKEFVAAREHVSVDDCRQRVDVPEQASIAGEVGDEGWQRASCRSTRRNYLKREAKRAARKQAAENASAEIPYSEGDDQADLGAANLGFRSTGNALPINSTSHLEIDEARKEGCLVDDRVRSCNHDESKDLGDLDQNDSSTLQACTEGCHDVPSVVDDTSSICNDAASCTGDLESEESWTVAPLWKSNIACMTADFAMQNVLLQMGLRLLSTNGMHIRELNKWVLKCQACNHVVSDVGRLFCSKCGNGGTLFKVSATVGQNGTVHAGRSRRVNLRGTRYSLPMPKGGREGAAQNPILREDQLPRLKKGVHTDRSVLTDVNFIARRDKRATELAGVKEAAAIFGGRRNPNERRNAVRG